MDKITKTSLVKIMQKEFVRRNLIKFFEDKGYNNFLVNPNPPSLMDLVDRVDVLQGIAEVKYYIEDINMENNMIKVGWNLFLLGNQRAFLGHTSHTNLTEIESSIGDPTPNVNGNLSIKEIIEWSVETIGQSSKLKDLYDQSHSGTSSELSRMDTIKPYKSVPDFKRRV